ncbi:hypothetical protein OUZ56_028319 [Daphnia magna]|uniref:Uncharacterized protein n=1 Tax=Daphnia magna TaxID=35525 RepID=A0ABR0B3I3_9CRUS|nr:hypothetical protein OUZ56_028319 [Daphnia magna]
MAIVGGQKMRKLVEARRGRGGARCIIAWPKDDDGGEDVMTVKEVQTTPFLHFGDTNNSPSGRGSSNPLCRFHPRCLVCCGKSYKVKPVTVFQYPISCSIHHRVAFKYFLWLRYHHSTCALERTVILPRSVAYGFVE